MFLEVAIDLYSQRSEQYLKLNVFILLMEIPIRSGTTEMPIRTNNWDVETYRNNLEKLVFS